MRDFIKQTALSVGFDACGIAKATALKEDAVFMKQWLAEGRHGEMHYLTRNFEKRTDPRVMVPGCKSVVVVLLNYFPEKQQTTDELRIAKYAYSAVDYHSVIKAKLTTLEQKICETYGSDAVSPQHQHTFVDSAPVLERRWAERAGLGWIGKHTQLIHPGLGSYCFIGVLMLNVETEYDFPIRPACGNCNRCVDACPTNAIQNGIIDARKCISYLTIENKHDIPAEFHTQLAGCVLGCDICGDVCPWNKKWAKPHEHADLDPVVAVLEWDQKAWLQLTESGFTQLFNKSVVKRTGYTKLKQNIKAIFSQSKC